MGGETTTKRLRFRRAERWAGLVRVTQGPRDHVLVYGDDEVIRVAQDRREPGFFFYGRSLSGARINTLTEPWEGKRRWSTEAEADAAAKDFFKRGVPGGGRDER